jgi:spermidine synthase
MVMVLVKFVWQDHANLVYKSRNFYGVLNVAIENDANGEYYSLMNGQIEHGTQYQDDYWRTQPTTYYGAGSAVDLAMRLHPRRRSEDPAKRALRVGIVGLGAGTIAAYGKPGDSFRFYEINRNVVNVAKQYFSYLEDSAAQTQVVVGDARVAMEQELASGGSHQFDVLAIDAFSSDAIPLHLLTRECSDLYRQHLAADGLLLIHISNRYLDLNPITLALAEYLGRKAVRIDSDDNVDLGIHSATWIVITANEAFLSNSEVQDAHWPWAEDQAKQMWTDDFASLWQVISY